MNLEPRLSTRTALLEPDELTRGFVRYVMETAKGFDGHASPTERLVAQLGPHSAFVERLQRVEKAAVSATGTPADIAAVSGELARAFLNTIAPTGLRGKVPFLRLPPHVTAPYATTTGSAGFVADGGQIPVFRLDVQTATLGGSKIASIAVFTTEFLRSVDDRSTSLAERFVSQIITEGEDEALLDAVAAVAGERPAGLTWNKSALGGGSPQGFPDDLSILLAETSDGNPTRPWLIVSARGLVWIAASFPGLVTATTIAGLPYAVSKAAGSRVILIDADRVGLYDGGLTIDRAESASLQLDNAPTLGSAQVSMFQTNSIAVRLVRWIDWAAARDAVNFINLGDLAGSPS